MITIIMILKRRRITNKIYHKFHFFGFQRAQMGLKKFSLGNFSKSEPHFPLQILHFPYIFPQFFPHLVWPHICPYCRILPRSPSKNFNFHRIKTPIKSTWIDLTLFKWWKQWESRKSAVEECQIETPHDFPHLLSIGR